MGLDYWVPNRSNCAGKAKDLDYSLSKENPNPLLIGYREYPQISYRVDEIIRLQARTLLNINTEAKAGVQMLFKMQ